MKQELRECTKEKEKEVMPKQFHGEYKEIPIDQVEPNPWNP